MLDTHCFYNPSSNVKKEHHYAAYNLKTTGMVLNMTYREEMAKKTEKRIIDTANKLFKKQGYENVTVRDIIEAAKISNGAFYAHFKSKEALLEEALFFYDRLYYDYYQNELSSDKYIDKNALEKLELFILQISRIITMNGPATVRFYMSYALKNPAALARDNRYYYQILRELISECRKNKLINDLYTDKQLFDMLFYLNRSITLEWAIRDGTYSIEDKDELIHILIRQIRA